MNSLNPRAGDVPVPEDPNEIEAALRAGRISYRIFPYLEWRYGERGRAFTRSDSAWLAWLSRFDQESIRQEIAWLQRILSNRGMPSTILELHLEVLHRQLVRAIPSKTDQYAKLKSSAQGLRQAREVHMPAEKAERLVENCVASLPSSHRALVRGAAELLVAAIADQLSGAQNAVRSVESWLADVNTLRTVDALRAQLTPAECRVLDSQSFAETWCTALAATITASGVNKSRSEKHARTKR